MSNFTISNQAMSSQTDSYEAPTDELLAPEDTMTMAAFEILTQENANPLLVDKHKLPPYAGQKAVLFHFLPYAQMVIGYAEENSMRHMVHTFHVPSVVTNFYGEYSRLFEMGLTYTVEEWTTIFHHALLKGARHHPLAHQLSLRYISLADSEKGVRAVQFVLKKFSQGRIYSKPVPVGFHP